MNHFTSSIRKSIEEQNWYGALTLALTLPDICGQLENPTEGSKSRSVKWLKEWIEPLYTIERQNTPYIMFSAEDCYALRCSFLHEGMSNIEEQRARQILNDFHFVTPHPNLTVHNNKVNNTLQLQVDIFCNEIADAVDKWTIEKSDNANIVSNMNKLITIHDSSNGITF